MMLPDLRPRVGQSPPASDLITARHRLVSGSSLSLRAVKVSIVVAYSVLDLAIRKFSLRPPNPHADLFSKSPVA